MKDLKRKLIEKLESMSNEEVQECMDKFLKVKKYDIFADQFGCSETIKSDDGEWICTYDLDWIRDGIKELHVAHDKKVNNSICYLTSLLKHLGCTDVSYSKHLAMLDIPRYNVACKFKDMSYVMSAFLEKEKDAQKAAIRIKKSFDAMELSKLMGKFITDAAEAMKVETTP